MFLVMVGIGSVLLGMGLLTLQLPFFKLAMSTTSLLDAMLEGKADESVKQKLLIQRLGRLLQSLLIFIFLVIVIAVVSVLPLFLYAGFNFKLLASFNYSSWQFYTVLAVGSLLPFLVVPFFITKQTYSPWSKLLHRMLLNNYNISRSLFTLENRVYSKRHSQINEEFIIITGLARCGTTALTSLLHRSDEFHSLSYANLPFLLSPNLWKKVYKPRDSKLKERSHGDNVMFGYNTIEALEEYFFKAFLKDAFIGENELHEHIVNEELYQKYLAYQNLANKDMQKDTLYLSKNNNFILRYQSLREYNPHFKAFFLFRDPLNHAYSLLKQHQRFSEMQQDDRFVKEYMNWLGHHEFGGGHKAFKFEHTTEMPEEDLNSINYWLFVWMNYYRRVLQLPKDEHLYLLEYADFLLKPRETVEIISRVIDREIIIKEIEPFKNTNQYEGGVDQNLLAQANEIYSELQKRKLAI